MGAYGCMTSWRISFQSIFSIDTTLSSRDISWARKSLGGLWVFINAGRTGQAGRGQHIGIKAAGNRARTEVKSSEGF